MQSASQGGVAAPFPNQSGYATDFNQNQMQANFNSNQIQPNFNSNQMQPEMNPHQMQPEMNPHQIQPEMNPHQIQPEMNPHQMQPAMNQINPNQMQPVNQMQPISQMQPVNQMQPEMNSNQQGNFNPNSTQGEIITAPSQEKAQKLFVGGVSRDSTSDAFASFFGSYGEMTDCILMFRDGRSRCFGFVTYAEASAMNQVLVSTLELDGKVLDVKIAVPEDKMSREGGGGQRTLKVHVGNLPPELTKEEFKSHFSQFGEVQDAFIVKEKETQQSRGFGFVTYTTDDSVRKALSHQSHILCGREVNCNKAKPPTPRPSRGGYDYYNDNGRPGPYHRRDYNPYARDSDYYDNRRPPPRRYYDRAPPSRYAPYDYGRGYDERGYGPRRGRDDGYNPYRR